MLTIKTLTSFTAVTNNIARKANYSIETRGMRKVVWANGKKLFCFRPGLPNPDLQNKTARNLLKTVRASVTRYIKAVDYQVPVIEKKFPSIFTNRFFWQSIPVNTDFYIIDAKHAYWRIAYLLGYISKKIYNNYAENKELKTVKNIALAILNSTHKKEYFVSGKKIHEIECDNSPYKQAYNNIRYFSYNLCGELRNSLDDSCFAYRTDGVFILKPGLHDAKKIFEKHNLLYKIEKCVKISDKSYSTADGELKNFV